MNDLVKRLRDVYASHDLGVYDTATVIDAADELERLYAFVGKVRASKPNENCMYGTAEVDQALAELYKGTKG